MHAQGLLVPIAGTVSMHRAEPGGEPTHFLFRADVSRTAGVPGVAAAGSRRRSRRRRRSGS